MKPLLTSIMLLITFYSTCQISWMRNYTADTSSSYTTIIKSVTETSDGNLAFIASEIKDFYAGVWLVKTSPVGDTLWSKLIGLDNMNIIPNSFKETSDGGFIIAGTNAFLIKTNSIGDTLWTQTYGDQFSCEFNDVEQTLDGGYIMTGYIASPDESLWIVKTNDVGDTSWTKQFDSPSIGYDIDYDPSNNGYVVGARKDDGTFGGDGWLLKTTHYGDTLWTRTSSLEIKQVDLFNGGYLSVGGIGPIKFTSWDLNGNVNWIKDYNLGFGTAKDPKSIVTTSDGGCVVVGDSWTPMSGPPIEAWVMKVDNSGDSLWYNQWYYGDGFYSIDETSDNGLIIGGKTSSHADLNGYGHGWLVKLDENGLLQLPIIENVKIEIFPNPVIDEIHFKELIDNKHVLIYSLTGAIVSSRRIYNNKIKVENLPSGLYLLKLEDHPSKPIKFYKD